jgi:hypothetical protein
VTGFGEVILDRAWLLGLGVLEFVESNGTNPRLGART